MNVLLHIGWYKLAAVAARASEFKPANMFKQAASLAVFGGFAYVCYVGAQAGTSYLLGTAHLGLFLLHRFLSMALFVFFLSVNIGNIVVSYATFYRSAEVSYYLTTPVSHGGLFFLKFLDNFFSSSAAFILIATALLAGYGSYFQVSVWFYFGVILLMLLPLMLCAGALAVVLLIGAISVSRPIGVKRLIILMIMVYLAILYGYFLVINPNDLVNGVLAHYPDVDRYFGTLDPWIVKALPSHWISDALYWYMSGMPEKALLPVGMLLGVTAVSLILMVRVGRRLFYRSWMVAQELQGDRPATGGSTPWSMMGKWQSNPQLTVLLKKEFWQFVREPSQWIHLSVIAVLLLTFLVSVAGIDFRHSIPFLQSVSYSVLLVFNSFLIASIALRFVYPSLSLEGACIWSVYSAPVRRTTVFWMKFWIGMFPVLFLTQALVLIMNRSLADIPQLGWSIMLVMAGVSYALIGLNYGSGVFFADFQESNPLRITSSQGATLTFLISIIFITLVVGLLFMPVNNYFEHVLRGARLFPSMLAEASLVIVIISLLIGTASLWVGARALRRDV